MTTIFTDAIVFLIIGFIILVFVGSAIYGWKKGENTIMLNKQLKNLKQGNDKEKEELKKKLGELENKLNEKGPSK